MTIALGLPCQGGLLICADQEVQQNSRQNSDSQAGEQPGQQLDKYYEERISCFDLFGSAVVSTYAGSHGLWKEANEKVARRLLELQGPEEEGDVCVIPQAILRLLATPKTTAVLPSKLPSIRFSCPTLV